MIYGIREEELFNMGLKRLKYAFFIDIDERVCDGFKHPTKIYL